MPSNNNTFKKNTFKSAENTRAEKKGRKKAWSRPGKFSSDSRVRKAAGLFMVLLSVFLLLSFVSYLFSWKADDALLDGRSFNWALLTDSSIEVDNMMGRIGAILAHFFIKHGFGIASFAFVLILFVAGIRILSGFRILPVKRTIANAVFLLVWFSVFFGYLIGSGDLLILGGIFGYEGALWLNGLLGKAGTAILLLFTAGVWVIIVFDPSFRNAWVFLTRILSGKQNGTKAGEPADTADSWNEESVAAPHSHDQIHTGPDEESDTQADSVTAKPVTAPKEEYEEPAAEVAEQPVTSGIELDTLIPDAANNKEEKAVGDHELEIEIADGKVTGSNYQAIEDPYSDTGDDMPDLSHLGEYDPTLDLPRYRLPELRLLNDRGSGTIHVNKDELEANKNRIIETLNNYNISIDKIKATVGPTVTLYEIIPAPGVRISKIRNLENDIALSLAALGIRIIAPIPGKGTIGIEVPNSQPEIVSMKSVLGSDRFRNSSYELPIGLGKTIANETFIADLTKMPHLLMAGATGQGKSVGLNAILASILYKKHPAYVKFVLVDPKKVELNLFSKIERHFLAKLPDAEEAIVTETRQVVRTINSLCIEMDNRYDLLKDAQARNVKEYNAKFVARRLNPNMGHRFLPYIVLFIDEFADLIMTAGKEIELPIARLAQLARAVGIHLIIATQRPSVNIITGTIKANFPARVAFRVTSKIDSRTILDSGGAEQLIGRGDMLLSTGSDLLRLQCAFIDTPEIERICEFIGSQKAYPDAFHLPEYHEDEAAEQEAGDPSERDELFEDAARIVVSTQQGSTSLIQRKLKLGYNRAGRIIDQLEAAGIVGPFEGSKAREVRVRDEMRLEEILQNES